MQTDGLVTTYLEESSSGPPRKYYQLTKASQCRPRRPEGEWNVFTEQVAKVLSDVKPDARLRFNSGQDRRRHQMTELKVLDTLRRRLAGLPPAEIDDLVGDYATHFADGRGGRPRRGRDRRRVG